jgi:amino acid transporter
MGVVSFLITPFLRDIALALQWHELAAAFDLSAVRLAIALGVLWAATGVNLLGIKTYERLMVPLMFLTFALGAVVIVAGFSYTQGDFLRALMARGETTAVTGTTGPLTRTLLPASVLLFSSFIGFDSIAQAGGEAKRPGRDLPLAIFISVGVTALFYFLFTAAVYHTVPWQYVAREAQTRDVTAPGLLGVVLPPFWTVVIVSSASVALIKDLPAMLLGVSRLMFAWAEDGIFPAAVAAVHPRFRTPHVAILLSTAMATIGVVGCHLAGDWFLGVDILVTSMLINFLLMALSVLALPARNPALAAAVTVLPSAAQRVPVAVAAVGVLTLYLVVHTWQDVTGPAAWYFKSTPVWAIVMALASMVYAREMRRLRRQGVDVSARFLALPPE